MNPLVQKLCDLVPLATTPEARALLLRAIEIEEEKAKEIPVCPLCGSRQKLVVKWGTLFECGTSINSKRTSGSWTAECQRIRNARIP